MPVPLPEIFQRHRLTIIDYHRMGEAGILTEDSRVELIEGELIDMAPIGSSHAGMVKRLNRIFDRAVGNQAIVSVQDPILLGQYSEPQPDIALLRPRDDFYAKSHPHPEDVLLIVEVAESSLRYDREVKIPLYALYGIPEVWLVDAENKQLTVFHTPTQQNYREEIRPEVTSTLQLTCLSEIKIDLSELF